MERGDKCLELFSNEAAIWVVEELLVFSANSRDDAGEVDGLPF